MKAKTMSKKQGIYFAVCNVVAGLGNYLFQLDASHSLSLVEFGTFTSWIAQVSTVMSLAMFFNYFSNFIELSDRTVTMLCLGTLALGGFGLSTALLAEISIPLLFAGFVAIVLRLTFSWVDGQIQRRLLFYALGTSITIKTATKLIIPRFETLFASMVDLYAWAFAVCLLPAAIFSIAVVTFQFTEKHQQQTLAKESKSKGPVVAMAIAAMLFVVFARS
jgi:hypothetical protein